MSPTPRPVDSWPARVPRWGRTSQRPRQASTPLANIIVSSRPFRAPRWRHHPVRRPRHLSIVPESSAWSCRDTAPYSNARRNISLVPRWPLLAGLILAVVLVRRAGPGATTTFPDVGQGTSERTRRPRASGGTRRCRAARRRRWPPSWSVSARACAGSRNARPLAPSLYSPTSMTAGGPSPATRTVSTMNHLGGVRRFRVQ